MPKQVILTKGLSGCGKTTSMKKLQDKNKGQYKRINKDDLRSMLDNNHWNRNTEKFVLQVRDTLITKALAQGFHVIIDDTNLHKKHETRIRQVVTEFNKEHDDNVQVRIEDFTDVPLETCIEQDLQRYESVGKDVIMKQYYTYLHQVEPLEQNQSLPKAVIFDIDGTLAKKGSRSPYDWERVIEDDPIQPTIEALYRYLEAGYRIVLFSGRDSVCKKETREWLAQHNIPYDKLYMRPENNTEKDSVIKKRLFFENIYNKYYVEAVFDDRKQVKRAWVDLGLFVFDVNQYDLEF